MSESCSTFYIIILISLEINWFSGPTRSPNLQKKCIIHHSLCEREHINAQLQVRQMQRYASCAIAQIHELAEKLAGLYKHKDTCNDTQTIKYWVPKPPHAHTHIFLLKCQMPHCRSMTAVASMTSCDTHLHMRVHTHTDTYDCIALLAQLCTIMWLQLCVSSLSSAQKEKKMGLETNNETEKCETKGDRDESHKQEIKERKKVERAE